MDTLDRRRLSRLARYPAVARRAGRPDRNEPGAESPPGRLCARLSGLPRQSEDPAVLRRVFPAVRRRERQNRRADRLDRKSTRLNPVTNAHLVCRLLLEKKNRTEQLRYT